MLIIHGFPGSHRRLRVCNYGITQFGKVNYNLTQELCTLQHDRCDELGAETKH